VQRLPGLEHVIELAPMALSRTIDQAQLGARYLRLTYSDGDDLIRSWPHQEADLDH